MTASVAEKVVLSSAVAPFAPNPDRGEWSAAADGAVSEFWEGLVATMYEGIGAGTAPTDKDIEAATKAVVDGIVAEAGGKDKFLAGFNRAVRIGNEAKARAAQGGDPVEIYTAMLAKEDFSPAEAVAELKEIAKAKKFIPSPEISMDDLLATLKAASKDLIVADAREIQRKRLMADAFRTDPFAKLAKEGPFRENALAFADRALTLELSVYRKAEGAGQNRQNLLPGARRVDVDALVFSDTYAAAYLLVALLSGLDGEGKIGEVPLPGTDIYMSCDNVELAPADRPSREVTSGQLDGKLFRARALVYGAREAWKTFRIHPAAYHDYLRRGGWVASTIRSLESRAEAAAIPMGEIGGTAGAFSPNPGEMPVVPVFIGEGD